MVLGNMMAFALFLSAGSALDERIADAFSLANQKADMGAWRPLLRRQQRP
jgi:uncharacterized protein YejL (UPF0352 family)